MPVMPDHRPNEVDIADGKVEADWVQAGFCIRISHSYGEVHTTLDEGEARWLAERLIAGLNGQVVEVDQIAEEQSGAGAAALAIEGGADD